MGDKERSDLFSRTHELLASLFDNSERDFKISAEPMDEATDQITLQDKNGEQVIRVPEEPDDSSS